MIKPSSIKPDIELRNALTGQITVGTAGGGSATVVVYSDWERPTNELPDDFLTVYINGDPAGVGMDTNYAKGYLMVSLYCKLNDDGSVKKNRVERILAQFEEVLERHISDNYYYRYDTQRFITPTSPNYTSGYSVTTLNLKWHTVNK